MARMAAFGIVAVGLLLWLHTFQALAMLQFTPSVETQRTFGAWTTAMLCGPIVVLSSALLIALLASKSRVIAWVAAVPTAILAARVWENVEGYLTPLEAALPISGTPLAYSDWPFVYQHGWLVFGGVAIIALGGAAYAAWSEGPLHLLPLVLTMIVVVGLVAIVGEVSFAPMSVPRLRNWSIVVAVIDAALVAVAVRTRRAFVAAAFLIPILAFAYLLHASWVTIASEMPHNVPTPAW